MTEAAGITKDKDRYIQLNLNRDHGLSIQLNVRWNTTEVGNVKRVYIEMYKMASPYTFHDFVDCDKKEYNIPAQLKDKVSKYKIKVYGLKQVKRRQKQCYVICASCQLEMRALGKSSKGDMVMSATSDYVPMYKPEQEYPETRIRHIDAAEYEVLCSISSKKVILIMNEMSSCTTYVFSSHLPPSKKLDLPLSLKPAKEYSFYIHQGQPGFQIDQSTFSEKFTKIEQFTAYMTKVELQKLLEKAKRCCSNPGSARLYFFYRNKPPAYYDDIFEFKNGIMVPYIKDKNGDQASIINGNLKGLFFSAIVDIFSNPPIASYFGKRRLYFKSSFLFNNNTNLYFADIYCHNNHYVTLVITNNGSHPDVFCKRNLIELDKYNNPFLWIVPFAREEQVYVTLGIKVEVFYTEAVNLHLLYGLQGGFLFEDVPTLGRGSSKQEGIPKNPNCQVCNL